MKAPPLPPVAPNVPTMPEAPITPVEGSFHSSPLKELKARYMQQYAKEAVELAFEYAQKNVEDLELWSWTEEHLPPKMLQNREKVEIPLFESFLKEFLAKQRK